MLILVTRLFHRNLLFSINGHSDLLSKFFNRSRCLLFFLRDKINDGAADDDTIGDACHCLCLFRRVNAETDSGWNVGILLNFCD